MKEREMKTKNRVIRLATALTVASVISAQIPMSGGTALAADGYKNGGGGKFLGTSLTNEQVFSGVTLGAIGISLLKSLRDKGKVAAPPSGGGSMGGGGTTPVMAASDCQAASLIGDGSKDLYSMLSGASGNSFSALKGLVDDSGIAGTLKTEGPFTILAPNNGSLGQLPASAVSALRADKAKLAELLSTHTLIGRYKYADLCAMKEKNLLTLSGKTVKLTTKDGKVQINGIQVSPVDIAGSNGYAHPLNGVIL
jgi:uncharacterized surface protein with fasciclin (FAS1) repeats